MCDQSHTWTCIKLEPAVFQNCNIYILLFSMYSYFIFFCGNQIYSLMLTGIVVSKSHHKYPKNSSTIEIILSTVLIVLILITCKSLTSWRILCQASIGVDMIGHRTLGVNRDQFFEHVPRIVSFNWQLPNK